MTQLMIDYTPWRLCNIGKERGWFTEDKLYLIPLLHEFTAKLDRTRTVDYGIKMAMLDEIPTGSTEKTFEDICNQEAIKLIETGKPLSVYWSGGIDSTLVLVSLLKNNAKDLTIILTSESIKEYPWFYETYIKNKLEVRHVRMTIFNDVDPTELMVTGDLGDQLMGAAVIRENKDNFETLHTMKWQEYVGCKYRKDYLDLITPQVEKAPFKIISAFDFIWWLSFSLNWQQAILMMGNNCADQASYLKNVRHFYRAEDFQLWSMNEANHRTHKVKNTFKSYKYVMKKIIGDWTLDRDYQENKIKVSSLPVRLIRPYLFRLQDGTRIEFGVDSTSPAEYEKKYGDQYDYLFSK